jgi:hypothetical protein
MTIPQNSLSAVGTKGKSCGFDDGHLCIDVVVPPQIFLVGGWLFEYPEYDV